MAGLRFVLVELGVQYATTSGTIKMQVLRADSLVSQNMVSSSICSYNIVAFDLQNVTLTK